MRIGLKFRRLIETAGSACSGVALLIAASITVATVAGVHADDPATIAAQMANRAFALLNSLNAQSGGGSSNPLLGPIASFASDAETLSNDLAKGNTSLAAGEMTTLQSDRTAVDSALASHAGAIKTDEWHGVEHELDELNGQLTGTSAKPAIAGAAPAGPAAAAPIAPVSAPPAVSASVAPSANPAVADGSVAPTSPALPSDRAAPKIVIDSRVTQGDVVRTKGYMEGTALKSAGIYENGRRLRAFKVNDVPGEQKLEFDLGLGHPSADTVIRVSDVDGRFAEAPVIDAAASAAAPPSLTPESSTPDKFGDSSEGGVDVYRGAGAGGGSHANTAEIPSHGAPLPSPSKRHSLGGNLANVRINILGVSQTQTIPPVYHVVGQISGRGITRAGIYVDDRLAAQIPIEDSADYTSFDRQFEMNGTGATIRAYGVGNQFVESNIDLTNQDLATFPPTAPMAPIASGIAVQITSIRPAGANVYVVSGAISGSGLASAGLYQNGVLAQNLSLGGGIGAVLGSLIPGANRSVSFSARFNPTMGPATIRAFDTNGSYTEQPVTVAGMSPYGYGASPYAGVNPYATSPYAAPVSPYYGTPPVSPYYVPARPAPPPSRPLW